MSRALVVALVLTSTGIARADEPAPDAADDVSTKRRLAAIGAALVPGVILHGSGSWVLHEKRAAKRLAITGAIGFAALGIGGASVGISGANPKIVIWGVPMIIAGAGLVLPTWFADVWYAAGGPRVRGESHAPSAWWVEAGTTYLHDAYRERAHVRTAGHIEIGRIGIGASTLVDAGGQARTGDVEARVRLLGAAATGATVTDASRLYVRAAVRRHEDDDDKVAITTVEADVGMRADLHRLDPNLAGSFLDIAIGMGIERVRYADLVSDNETLFLGRFAWGLYLGQRSELSVFYDHRRDSLAGGIAASRAAGFVGSVGGNVDLRIGGPLSFVGELEIGSGWVTTAGIRYHGGPL